MEWMRLHEVWNVDIQMLAWLASHTAPPVWRSKLEAGLAALMICWLQNRKAQHSDYDVCFINLGLHAACECTAHRWEMLAPNQTQNVAGCSAATLFSPETLRTSVEVGESCSNPRCSSIRHLGIENLPGEHDIRVSPGRQTARSRTRSLKGTADWSTSTDEATLWYNFDDQDIAGKIMMRCFHVVQPC